MNDLDELKKLLFGAEKQALDSITQRVERREARAADVADILPEAIYQSHGRGGDLTDSLKAPVGECLQQVFHDDPQTYGDALYPVMGPAIRKSIMQALRTLAQQINAAVEQSLTPKGLSWRFQAWRAGVPFGEFVLQKTLLYRVEQAYLISRENGLLVSHVHHEAAKIKDSDAVSAMFTAIQDFVKESFSPDRTGRLESADMGEFTLWAVHGPHALLVCVIRGVPPKGLRAELSAVLERIHFRYGDAIRTYSGSTESIEGVADELAACLRFEARHRPERASRRVSLPLSILLAILGVAIIYLLASRWLLSQKASDLAAALDATPGYYVSRIDVLDGRLVVRGMRDPLAPSVTVVAEGIGVSAGEVASELQAFQSLAPKIVAVRAARFLGRPPGVEFAVSGSTLVISGPAPLAWQQGVRDKYAALAGVEDLEFRLSADDRVRITREFLQPPDGVRLTAEGDGVVVAGTATAAWIESATTRVADADAPWAIEIGNLTTSAHPAPLAADIEALSGSNFFFSDGTELTEDAEAAFAQFVDRLGALRERAARQGLEVVVTLTGYTDSVGDMSVNERLAARRTQAVADAILRSGHDATALSMRQVTAAETDPVVNPKLRRVSAELVLVEPSPTQ